MSLESNQRMPAKLYIISSLLLALFYFKGPALLSNEKCHLPPPNLCSIQTTQTMRGMKGIFRSFSYNN